MGLLDHSFTSDAVVGMLFERVHLTLLLLCNATRLAAACLLLLPAGKTSLTKDFSTQVCGLQEQ